jgi:site-specific recombinase XerD
VNKVLNLTTEESADDQQARSTNKLSIAQPISKKTLESRLETWIDYLAIEQGTSEKTHITYTKEVKRFLIWLDANHQAIEKSTIVAYRSDLRSRYAPATVNLTLVAVRRFLDWLEEEEVITHNPAKGIKGIKDPDRSHTRKRDELTPSEVKKVIAAIDNSTIEGKRDLALVSAMAYGALRQIEVQRARIGDYRNKGSRRILWIWARDDSKADDYIVVNSNLETALTVWVAEHPGRENPEAALFCSLHPRTYCREITTRHIRRIVKEYFRSAGIQDAAKTTHSLRNSAIAAVIRAGGSLIQVQRVARHIDPRATEKYLYDYDRLKDPAEFLIQY